ncbi:hypothetical protein JCM19236_4331 [Vibrio sp. JCM 19236]|nr:hypothetical protein JCM19236_4331 [Vibrio sp. JCM 19236]
MPKAKAPVEVKGHAQSAMTKAPGPQTSREINIEAAPFTGPSYEPKGAGSQAATSQAGSAMSKTLG